jgi:hypothetical protein
VRRRFVTSVHGISEVSDVTDVAQTEAGPGGFPRATRNEYQVFVDTPWLGRSPEQLAAAVRATLAQPPGRWTATWHAMWPSLTTAPTIAGSLWRREQL